MSILAHAGGAITVVRGGGSFTSAGGRYDNQLADIPDQGSPSQLWPL